jgi:hypothetical protein
MPTKAKKRIIRFYAYTLRALALLLRFLFKPSGVSQKRKAFLRIVLLVSRPQDVELLTGIHEKARQRKDLLISFWMLKKCDVRFPDVLPLLKEKGIVVDQFVDFTSLLEILKEFMRTDVFLSTVESTAAKHKLPYILTRMANAADVSTYTMQHGFENIGLSYRDEVYGSDVKFAARTVLTWGPTEGLPAWVGKDTLDKTIAVGCPKEFVVLENNPSVGIGERPIIGVFDNLHWHRYDEKYRETFLRDLKTIAEQREEFRFILRSHPASIRKRSRELAERLSSMDNVEVVDLMGRGETLTTSWLLSNATGVITTPSTIALDAALANVPIAVSRYELDLAYYSHLSLLDGLKDWQRFLDQISEKSGASNLKRDGERFLSRVIVSGDAAAKTLDFMTREE